MGVLRRQGWNFVVGILHFPPGAGLRRGNLRRQQESGATAAGVGTVGAGRGCARRGLPGPWQWVVQHEHQLPRLAHDVAAIGAGAHGLGVPRCAVLRSSRQQLRPSVDSCSRVPTHVDPGIVRLPAQPVPVDAVEQPEQVRAAGPTQCDEEDAGHLGNRPAASSVYGGVRHAGAPDHAPAETPAFGPPSFRRGASLLKYS